MQKVYRNTALFIFLILLGVQWGFYRRYTSQFPDFINKTTIIHVHGALLMMWIILLIVQPILIGTGRIRLHRNIGKLSYVLGPLIILSLFLVSKESFNRHAGLIPKQLSLSVLVLDIRGFLKFTLFWTLAMLYRKVPGSHMRYMIATGILAIGPGVGRGLMYVFGVGLGRALTITDVAEIAIVGSLLGYDIYKRKNYKPWLLVFIAFLVGAILWQARDTQAWQAFAKTYAEWFY